MSGRILFCKMLVALWLSSGVAFSQSTGDFRTHQSGNWGDLSTWERYNGSMWEWPAPSLPDTLGFTTIRAGDSVSVTSGIHSVGNSLVSAGGELVVIGVGDTSVQLRIANGTMTVSGLFKQTGGPAPSPGPYAVTITGTGSMVVATGGTLQQDQNGGQVPRAIWNDGSTLLVTGIVGSTSGGAAAGHSYYNLVWDCPGQTANTNPGFNPVAGGDTTTTIRGDLIVLNTGLARMQLSGPPAGSETQRTVSRININGNIRVLNGSIFSATGTGSAYTDIIVTVHGNITVRDSAFVGSAWRWSQLSISRGTQGGTGTTTWYIKGDSVYYGPKTTNSNSTEGSPPSAVTNRGRFIFCKPGVQVVTLDDSVGWTGPCNMQFGDSVTTTTIYVGNSQFIGSGCVQRVKRNATVVIGPDGYIGGGTGSGGPSNFAIDNGATLVIASQNGIRATGHGSSGAVRVSGDRDYGTAANFVYNGTSNQRLGSGFPASANNLTIDNPIGAWVDSVSAFTINGALTIANGDLNLNGCTITLGPDGELSETPGNTVKGLSGVITATRLLTSPSVATDIAGLGVAIGSSADLGSTIITRGHAVQTGVGAGNSISRYFDIQPANNTGLNATLVFRYDESELNALPEASLALYRSTNAGASWSSVGGAVSTGANTITVSGLASLSRWTAGSETAASISVPYSTGWNMISNPALVSNDSVRQLFPAAVFNYAFSFSPLSGYSQSYRLLNGVGYWEKFPAGGSANIAGTALMVDTIAVATGWNMIGSISVPVDTAAVFSIPSGIRTSLFFGYSGGFVPADVIQPGKAYWVKVSSAGGLVLSSSGPARPNGAPGLWLNHLNSITLTDATGARQTLYFGADDNSTVPVEMFEMPPAGPEGVFDARFESQRLVDLRRRGESSAHVIALSSVVAPLVMEWEVMDSRRYVVDDGTTPAWDMAARGRKEISMTSQGKLIINRNPEQVPAEFRLVQNYPNPFNPATVIAFSVPSTSRATLEVYTLLGQRVGLLFDDVAEAGQLYRVQFDGRELASGVYYYRLTAGDRMETKRLMLLK